MVVLLVVGMLATVAALDGLGPSEQTVTSNAELNSYLVFPEETKNNVDNQVTENFPDCPNTAILLRALNVLADSLAKEEQEVDINKLNYILKLLENFRHSPLNALEEEYNTVVINVKSLIEKNLSQNKDAVRSSSRKDKKKIKITVQYEIPVSAKCDESNKQINLIKHIAQHNIPGLANFKVIPDEAQSLIPSQGVKESDIVNKPSNLEHLLHHKNENNIISLLQNYRPRQSNYEANDSENINAPKLQYQPVNPQVNGPNNDYKLIEDDKELQPIYNNVPLAQNNLNSLPYYLINTPGKGVDPIGNKLGLLQNPNAKSHLDMTYNPEKLLYSQSPYLNPQAQGNLLNKSNTPKAYNGNQQWNVDTQDFYSSNQNSLNQPTRPQLYNNYPMNLQNPNQNFPNVFNQNNQNPILISSKNPQQHRHESNAKSRDKNRQVPYSLNLPNSRYIQTVTNFLNGTQTNNDQLVELTYVLQVPKAVHYQPLYMVKYRLPLKAFQENLNKLLERKPHLRNDPNRLYQELIVTANSTNTLSNIPGLKHREVINIISKDGMLVGSKILNSNETEMKGLNTIKELNSNLSSDDILNLNNRTFDKQLERLRHENVLDESVLANFKGDEKVDSNVSYQQVKRLENAENLVSYVQQETKPPQTKFVPGNVNYYPFSRPMLQSIPQIMSA